MIFSATGKNHVLMIFPDVKIMDFVAGENFTAKDAEVAKRKHHATLAREKKFTAKKRKRKIGGPRGRVGAGHNFFLKLFFKPALKRRRRITGSMNRINRIYRKGTQSKKTRILCDPSRPLR